MNEKRTSKQRILDVLLDGRSHHMRELNAISFRYGGRLYELRREGHVIDTERIGEGEFRYRLIRPVLRDRDAKQPALL